MIQPHSTFAASVLDASGSTLADHSASNRKPSTSHTELYSPIASTSHRAAASGPNDRHDYIPRTRRYVPTRATSPLPYTTSRSPSPSGPPSIPHRLPPPPRRITSSPDNSPPPESRYGRQSRRQRDADRYRQRTAKEDAAWNARYERDRLRRYEVDDVWANRSSVWPPSRQAGIPRGRFEDKPVLSLEAEPNRLDNSQVQNGDIPRSNVENVHVLSAVTRLDGKDKTGALIPPVSLLYR